MNSNLLGFLTSLGLTLFFSLIFFLYQFLGNPEMNPLYLTAKVTGMVAFLVFSFSVIYGLYQSNKLFLKFSILDAALSLSTHRYLSWMGLVLAIAHRQFHEIFLSSLESLPILTSFRGSLILMGNLALGLFLIIILSSELRGKYVPIFIWRGLHFLSFAGYFLILAHAILLGSSADDPFYLFWYLGTFAAIVGLTSLRIVNSILTKPEVKL